MTVTAAFFCVMCFSNPIQPFPVPLQLFGTGGRHAGSVNRKISLWFPFALGVPWPTFIELLSDDKDC